MKAPDFWWRAPGLASLALAPAAAIYGVIAGRRMAKSGATSPVPVLCIGNVTVGGSGKTPTALAVAALLREAGRSPAFLTRGYGGSLSGPVAIDPATHGSEEAGDEPLLLAQAAPTIVSRDRPAGAALAASLGADVVVMDDGLQNPSLAKTLSLAVFDGAVGIGNGRVLPSGPLRAPLSMQWPRIDAAIVIGSGEAGERVAQDAASRSIPVFRARLRPDAETADGLSGRRALAFAGIGRPGKFFETCREIGLIVEAERAFPDHHPYRTDEIAALLDEAERGGLVPVTTQKDAVRLARLRASEPRIGLVRTLPVTCAFGDPEAVQRFLLDRLASTSERQLPPSSC